MNKKIITFITEQIIVILCLFLIGAFIALSFDIRLWDYGLRMSTSVVYIGIVTIFYSDIKYE